MFFIINSSKLSHWGLFFSHHFLRFHKFTFLHDIFILCSSFFFSSFFLVAHNNHIKMSLQSYRDLPQSVLDIVKYTFSVENPANNLAIDGTPLFCNELVDYAKGKIRVVALNAACLLCGSSSRPFSFKKGAVEDETLGSESCTSMNIIHALLHMILDSFQEARKFGFEARKCSEEFAKKFDDDLKKFIGKEEYIPVVNSVKNFLSMVDHGVTDDMAKNVMLSFMQESYLASHHSDVGKGLFWTGAVGVVASVIISCLFPPAAAISFPFEALILSGGMAMRASNKHAISAIEIGKCINYCIMLTRFKNLLLNRPEYVSRNNVLLLAYDDFSPVASKKYYFSFAHSISDELKKYGNRGAMCDVVRFRGVDELAPCFGECISEETGQNVFAFYKDVFHRISISSDDPEQLQIIQDIIKGKPSPLRLLSRRDSPASYPARQDKAI